MLARPPADISLGDVIRAIHGQVFDTPALADQSCPPELRNGWKTLQAALDQTSNSLNFQQLLDQAGAKEKMYYI